MKLLQIKIWAMKMVVVFSVNGSLASYSIEYRDASHVCAQLLNYVDKRKDLPEKIEFLQVAGLWTSETKEELIKNSIIHALNHSVSWHVEQNS